MTKAYNDLPMWFRFILQLILCLGWPIAIIYRICRYFENKKMNTLLFALLCIPFGIIFGIADLITTLIHGKITFLVD